MKKQDKEEYNILCEYIANNILECNDRAIPKNLERKIKFLSCGNIKGNDMVYSYKMILCAFMMEKDNIRYALTHKTFSNESHKINYIMVLVEKHMNDIKSKVDNMVNTKTKIELALEEQKKNYVKLEDEDRYVRKSKDIGGEELWQN